MIALRQLEEVGYVGAGEAHFARLCAEGMTGEPREVLQAMVAVLCRFLIQGHPCVPLSTLAELPISDEDGQVIGHLAHKSLLESALAQAPSVQSVMAQEELGEGTLTRPLVLDSSERIYLARFFEHERRLASALGRLLRARPTKETDPLWLERRLSLYFAPSAGGPDFQREAAARALSRPLSVISGGPGTGKTSTVVKILALIFDFAEHCGEEPPSAYLLAPTGKAAARMMEAIQSALEAMECGPRLRHHIREATTIHRALGVLPHNKNRFRRGPNHPLRADVVIVDEASMVDLSLMRHLVEALRPSARLILLGDRHQLASVEAGSVLSELCAADLATNEQKFSIELQKSYRFSEESGIAELASAIRVGDAERCVRTLNAGRSDLTFRKVGGDLARSAELMQLVTTRYGRALGGKDAREVLEEMARFRILCAHRKGTFGVLSVNELVRMWLVLGGFVPPSARESRHRPEAEFYRGRLILITENDYELGLFNGDVGLIWPGKGGVLLAHFPEENGGTRALPPGQLPAHETAFALTIHKSQGSEHEEVALVLPQETSPLLTRELIYTGVTRAKKAVHLFGEEKAVRVAAQRSVVRHSGLSTALLAQLSTVALPD
jgi:exodeoxyribonuclease V alpha subunit